MGILEPGIWLDGLERSARERDLYGEEYAMGDLLHCSTLQQSLFDMMHDFPAGNPWNADIRKDETPKPCRPSV